MKRISRARIVLLLLPGLLVLPLAAFAAGPLAMSDFSVASSGGNASWGLAIRIMLFMTLLGLLPAMLVTMTSFTRIIVVLAIMRQGIGVPNVPGNQVLIGLALLMTLFVMKPVLLSIESQVIEPSIAGKIEGKQAFMQAGEILRGFMSKQTRKDDLAVFSHIAGVKSPDAQTVPLTVLMPAYVTSELKTAFEIGFLLLLPFLVIDIIVSSILMSLGMMMLSPMVISLPFKILFFVLVDGWNLVIMGLIGSFRF